MEPIPAMAATAPVAPGIFAAGCASRKKQGEEEHALAEGARLAERDIAAACEDHVRRAEQACAAVRYSLAKAMGRKAQLALITAQPRGDGGMSVQMDTAAGATCFPRRFAAGCRTSPATIALKSAKGGSISSDGMPVRSRSTPGG